MKLSAVLVFAPCVMALAIPNPASQPAADEKRAIPVLADALNGPGITLPGPIIQGLGPGWHNVVPAPNYK
ncbi:hypothetical protein ACJQWK_08366 [Exserohilum turcicum]|uniref:Uncharacterized protein n=1 Tax=Exserohilum turcicum (strain 28A) TaxID=671987 RepID=R0ISB0_EXST2|nr:uncharacterized protein SETTUDRAFT_28183 [Exserohilum turcica Et28A]EOA87546.1 hypothetical protein SETTUDRAFT_28183 [Exserohilum turcica Et28A]